MAIGDLGLWLLELPGFLRQLDCVVIDSACEELGHRFTRNLEHTNLKHNWSYLLLAASALAQTREGRCQAAALRIAQACLCDPSVSEAKRDSAAIVLDALANHPALDLAIARSLLQPAFESRVPGVARIDLARRSYEYTIQIDSKHYIRVNRFQRRLWDEIQANGWMSVSAPTSAGKSFILERWICEVVRSARTATIVYLVPTRALISQVERDMRALLHAEDLDDVSVSSLPISREGEADHRRVLVLTQERLHILLTTTPGLLVRALVVDEAHKVGDRHRGVLLQDVIERVTAINPVVKAIFASPMTSNPSILIADAQPGVARSAFTSDDVTVLQNLFWVTQQSRKPRTWDVAICNRGSLIFLGSLELAAVPNVDSKRLSFVAHAVASESPGNIIYVNGAAEAEKIAGQLYDLVGRDIAPGDDQEIFGLIELAQHVVHRQFLLATFLRRGVSFHYGNMPLLLREEIERLFSVGKIRYLVCTSTLIEGVNMSCRNIFMRGPTKGRGRPLSPEDFWNLAGRAGRWGKEFQGNIFCIDANRPNLWGNEGPPRERKRQPIRRTTDDVLESPVELLQFIRDRAPMQAAKERPELEYVFSYLGATHARLGDLRKAPWAARYGSSSFGELAEAVEQAVAGLSVSLSILERNPGISPYAIDDLLKYFRDREGSVEELMPVDPASDDAPAVYVRIFTRLAKRACPKLGSTPKRAYMLALLVTRWMRGHPLARLITDRINFLTRSGRSVNTAEVIRNVMDDVEQIARFEAPRGLGCYCDVLRQHLTEVGREDLLAQLPELSVFLELGVNQITQISLIGLGLSRTSTILLSELITADSMTESQALAWLVANVDVWKNSSLPNLVRGEVERIISQHSRKVP